ncbi:MAG: hypothetical protein HYU86_02845 [Chloroflexi bacterium]|nr:hypothetical protein [Chloroflexota bacterium]
MGNSLWAVWGLLGGGILLLLFQTSHLTSTGYEVQRLEAEKRDWQRRNYQLEAEIGRLQSLERIQNEATQRLKMVPATQYLYVVGGTPRLSSGNDRETVPNRYPREQKETWSWWGRFWEDVRQWSAGVSQDLGDRL